MRKNLLTTIIVGITILISAQALCTTDRFSILSYPLSGESNLLTLFGSEGPKRHGFGLRSDMEYSYKPLELFLAGQRFQGVVDHLFVQYFAGSFAPTSRFELDLTLPVVWYEPYRTPVLGSADRSSKIRLGDLMIRSRVGIFRRGEKGIGFGIIPFVTAPIGSEERFIGDRRPRGGAIVALDGDVGIVRLGLNIGGEVREKVSQNGMDLGSRLLLGGGGAVRLGHGFTTKADIKATTPFKKFFGDKINTSSELSLGAEYQWLPKNLTFGLRSALSLVRGAGTPLFRVAGGVSYNRPGADKVHVSKPPVEVAEAGKMSVYFLRGEDVLSSEARSSLDVLVGDLKGEERYEELTVSGHTDSRGSSEYNLELSHRRARAVADYLVEQGLFRQKIRKEGYGEEKPVDSNLTKEGRSRNRRVEVEWSIP